MMPVSVPRSIPVQKRSVIRFVKPRLQKIPYMLVVGAEEEEEKAVSVRSRFKGDEGQKDLKTFMEDILEEIRTKEIRKVEEEA